MIYESELKPLVKQVAKYCDPDNIALKNAIPYFYRYELKKLADKLPREISSFDEFDQKSFVTLLMKSYEINRRCKHYLIYSIDQPVGFIKWMLSPPMFDPFDTWIREKNKFKPVHVLLKRNKKLIERVFCVPRVRFINPETHRGKHVRITDDEEGSGYFRPVLMAYIFSIQINLEQGIVLVKLPPWRDSVDPKPQKVLRFNKYIQNIAKRFGSELHPVDFHDFLMEFDDSISENVRIVGWRSDGIGNLASKIDSNVGIRLRYNSNCVLEDFYKKLDLELKQPGLANKVFNTIMRLSSSLDGEFSVISTGNEKSTGELESCRIETSTIGIESVTGFFRAKKMGYSHVEPFVREVIKYLARQTQSE